MKQTLIKLQLTITDRWGVGAAPAVNDGVHLAVAKDPRDPGGLGARPHIPGSSLAGALRAHLQLVESASYAESWLGPAPGAREQTVHNTGGGVDVAARRVASPLAILGVMPVPMGIHLRGTTAIDPERGAAAASALRSEEWVDPGDVVVVMLHNGRPDHALLERLDTWRPVIGRGRSTGMGRASVTAREHLTKDLSRASDLTWWLSSERLAWYRAELDPAQPSGEAAIAQDPPPRQWHLRVVEPVHLGGGETLSARRADKLGQTLHTLKSGDQPVIPGSSWKGVFRHRVAAILSAVGAEEADADSILTALFGDSSGGRGLLRFDDSLGQQTNLIERQHVAIDRFTGGARDGALFRVEAMEEGTTLTLTVAPTSELPDSVWNLLAHVIRDLHDGLIGIGGFVSRGYGHVALADGPPQNPGAVVPTAIVEDLARTRAGTTTPGTPGKPTGAPTTRGVRS